MEIIKRPKFVFTKEEVDTLDRATDLIKKVKDEMADLDGFVLLKGNDFDGIDSALNVLVDIYNGIDGDLTLEFDFEP